MGSEEATRIPASPLRQLSERAKLGDEAMALLTEQAATKEFIGLLVEKELFRDALRLVAYLLPKRETIGWGCLCVRHTLASQPDKPVPQTQLAAERWVASPNEENRRAAKEPADRENPKTASGLLAMAVFFAGPSMAPANVQAVPPPDHLTSEMVAIAVALAGVASEPGKANEKYQVFMQKASALMERMKQSRQQ